jgi:hypothetical protein
MPRVKKAYMYTEVKLQAFQPRFVFIVVWNSHMYKNKAHTADRGGRITRLTTSPPPRAMPLWK